MKTNKKKLVNIIRTALLGAVISAPVYSAEEPNIIFILTDDLGFNQIGAYGDTKIKTPNLDKLADNGLLFTHAYAGNTVSSPSRVSLFTGRDSRIMKDNTNQARLDDGDVTLAHILKHASYETAMFGKYSIGYSYGITDPLSMGFDTWYGMNSILEGHRQYPQMLWRDGEKIIIKENEGNKKGAYAQELFTNEAIKFINKDRSNPFFVMLNYSSPHAELAAPERFVKMYDGVFDEEPYTGMSTGTPSDKYASYYPEPVEKPNATLAGMVTALDEYVGQVVQTLEDNDMVDNTVIIFTSDNGPHQEGGADPEYMRAAFPYKGFKRDLYDGGIHVPMVISWPDKIRKSRVEDTPIIFADFLPTFADLSGVSLNTVPRVRTNGVSIINLLTDEPQIMDDRLLYWEYGAKAKVTSDGVIRQARQAARKGEWKAVRYASENNIELYNIISDPGETTDVSLENSDVMNELSPLFK
ncbi:sulfatase-like hydrolase/transferase [Photobacterium sp. ZSDE20]|uniref:Sulfatase-like hydrolase/transferase n=1 Tax=Photobacterium pectinilyticum TaxID=2906793 RepID=A0ABT1N6C0_9GAMM|nr:sulfatase-like hydrolase/transferase [Photobacterium sp. ZSDE20]MCQ1060292.1 sulfatase-like hydrolase/transferase [Photobacterium sp. ZSDE20]MDD1827590.1 sulfatase-like hydrolase/transferase [Photobacterium sp. ZSDE20]